MHKAGMVQRVTNEVEIQCRLKHPSILEVRLSWTQQVQLQKSAMALIFVLLFDFLCCINGYYFVGKIYCNLETEFKIDHLHS